jgi:predicted nucleic acid-binding Zn ribbon protein
VWVIPVPCSLIPAPCSLEVSSPVHPLTAALPAALAQLLRGTPVSAGKVAFAWSAAVGPALQRVTSVCLEDGVLIVDAADGHWAHEISRVSSIILPRLQLLLGESEVTRIDVRC